MRTPGVGADDDAEPALAGSVPQLKLDSYPVDENDGLFVSWKMDRNSIIT